MSHYLAHYWEMQTRESAGASHLKTPSGGGVKNPGQVMHTTRSFLILVPSDPRMRCTIFFKLNGWTAFCYHDGFFKSWYPGHGNREPTVLCAPSINRKIPVVCSTAIGLKQVSSPRYCCPKRGQIYCEQLTREHRC